MANDNVRFTRECEFNYPYLNEPDTVHNKDGIYQVYGVFRGQEAREVMNEIEGWLDAWHTEQGQAKGGAIKHAPKPYKLMDNGEVWVKFSMKRRVVPSKGEPFNQRPNLYDADAQPWPLEKKIGYGSRGIIKYTPVHYHTSIGAGISFRLMAVQVTEARLVETEVADGFKPVARPTNAPIFQNPQTMPTPRPEAGQPVHAPQRYVAPPREDVKSNLVPQDTGWDDLPF